MTEVALSYRVPVLVVVDLDQERVISVTVEDERVQLDDDENDPVAGAPPDSTPASLALGRAWVERAVEIAEAEWPAWQFGG